MTKQTFERGSQAFRRGYLDGFHNRPNQAEIAGDDQRDDFPRADYSAGYVAGVIEADSRHAAKTGA